MRRPHTLAALAFALSFLASAPALADIVGTGDVSPTLPWNGSIYGYVGKTNDGSLTVNLGSILSSAYGYLGYSPGSTGTATVTGTGSTWNNSNLYVGYSGTGTLTVNDGGTVTANTLYASLDSLFGNGTITTKGAVLDADLVFDGTHPLQQTIAFGTGGSLTLNPNSGVNLGAGYNGMGTLRIADGMSVLSYTGYLGYSSNSIGTATVTGSNSKWTNGGLIVGRSGAGTLNIEAGGQVSNTYGYLGYGSGSTGTATVTGAGSTWTNSDTLYVGSSGAGSMKIEAGAKVSTPLGYLGYNAVSTGTATVAAMARRGRIAAICMSAIVGPAH